MYELFKLGATCGGLDLQGFIKIIEEVSEGNVGNADIETTFKYLSKNKTGKVSFQTFEEVFRSEVPTNAEFETKVIRSVR